MKNALMILSVNWHGYEGTSELEDMTTETAKIEKQREKKTENKTRMDYKG